MVGSATGTFIPIDPEVSFEKIRSGGSISGVLLISKKAYLGFLLKLRGRGILLFVYLRDGAGRADSFRSGVS